MPGVDERWWLKMYHFDEKSSTAFENNERRVSSAQFVKVTATLSITNRIFLQQNLVEAALVEHSSDSLKIIAIDRQKHRLADLAPKARKAFISISLHYFNCLSGRTPARDESVEARMTQPKSDQDDSTTAISSES